MFASDPDLQAASPSLDAIINDPHLNLAASAALPVVNPQTAYDQCLPEPHLRGTWGDGARWSFHLLGHEAPLSLSTVAMSVALCPDGIVLTLTERGYDELLGGHLEANETAVDAVLRESEEEGGIIIEHCKLVGIKRIENDPSDKPSRQQYPPVGYASYFVGYSSRYPGEPTGVEVVSRKVLPLDEAFSLDLAQFPERQEAILLLNAVLGCDIEAELRAGVSSAELISRVAAKLQEPPEFLKNAH